MDESQLEEKIKKLDEEISALEGGTIEKVEATTLILDKGMLYKEHKKKVRKCLTR